MSPFSSNDPRDYFGMAIQTAQRTEATASFKFLKYLSGGIKVDQETQQVYEGGDGQEVGLIYKSKVKPDGEIEVYARPDTFAWVAAGAMGSLGVAIPSIAAATVASHLYVPNSTVPFYTADQAFGGGNNIDRAIDTIISGLTIEGEAANPWKMTLALLGGGSVYYRDGAASALSATLEAGDPQMYAGGAYLIDGATSLDVTKWSWKFDRKIDDDLFTVAQSRRDLVPLTRGVSVDMQVIMQNPSYYKQIIYGGGSNVPINLATGGFRAYRDIGASGNGNLQIDVPWLRYTNVEVNRLAPDGQTIVLDISAVGQKISGTWLTSLRANLIGRASSYLAV